MPGWESLRADLLRLREESPGAVVVCPTPETERRSERQFLGKLDSVVIDGSGNVVGRYVGPRYAKRVGFAVEAQQSSTVPVLIGTASMDPDLGYAVPPGEWGLVIEVHTDEGHMWSAPLRITITP